MKNRKELVRAELMPKDFAKVKRIILLSFPPPWQASNVSWTSAMTRSSLVISHTHHHTHNTVSVALAKSF